MTTYESLQWKRLLAKPHDHWVVLSDLGKKTRTTKSESYFKFTSRNTPQAGGYVYIQLLGKCFSVELKLPFQLTTHKFNRSLSPKLSLTYLLRKTRLPTWGNPCFRTLNPQREDGVDTLRKSSRMDPESVIFPNFILSNLSHWHPRLLMILRHVNILRQPMAMPCLPTLTSMYLDRRLYTGRISV